MDALHVTMLGECSLRIGENQITDSDNRAKKVWLLLAYLICRRNRVIPAKELIDLLWGDESSSNPENTLKITLHRARALLDRLRPSIGRRLIVYRDGGYVWSDALPLTLDIDRFDLLCQTPPDAENALESYLEALKLYRGEFLAKLSSEVWVIPIATHFHNLYIQTVLRTAPLLMEKQEYRQAGDICRTAIALEPYHEALYQQLMQALSAAGNQAGVAAVYEDLSQKLFTSFGIKPGDETRAIYRAAASERISRSLPMEGRSGPAAGSRRRGRRAGMRI